MRNSILLFAALFLVSCSKSDPMFMVVNSLGHVVLKTADEREAKKVAESLIKIEEQKSVSYFVFLSEDLKEDLK